MEENSIIQEINELQRELSTTTVIFHQAIAEFAGLNATDHKYIDLLFKHGDMTPGKFTELSGLTTGAVTGMIDRLEKLNLVSRERSKSDRRKVLVVLNKQEAHKRIGPAFANMQSGLGKLYEGFDQKDLEVIREFLKRSIEFNKDQAKQLKEK